MRSKWVIHYQVFFENKILDLYDFEFGSFSSAICRFLQRNGDRFVKLISVVPRG